MLAVVAAAAADKSDKVITLYDDLIPRGTTLEYIYPPRGIIHDDPPGAIPGGPDSCSPDAPHGGLLSAMRTRAKGLPAGDELRDELEAAAALIDSYTTERESLCRDLGAGELAIAAARQQRDGWKRLYEAEQGTSELYRASWQKALVNPPAASPKQRLVACGPGGGVAYEDNGELRARVVAACIFPIFPR